MITPYEFALLALKILSRLGWALVFGLFVGVLISTTAHAGGLARTQRSCEVIFLSAR